MNKVISVVSVSEDSYMRVTALTLIELIILGWRLRACLKYLGLTSKEEGLPMLSGRGDGWEWRRMEPAKLPGIATYY